MSLLYCSLWAMNIVLGVGILVWNFVHYFTCFKCIRGSFWLFYRVALVNGLLDFVSRLMFIQMNQILLFGWKQVCLEGVLSVWTLAVQPPYNVSSTNCSLVRVLNVVINLDDPCKMHVANKCPCYFGPKCYRQLFHLNWRAMQCACRNACESLESMFSSKISFQRDDNTFHLHNMCYCVGKYCRI